MSGKLTLISSATASSSTSVDFTSGIDSTYDEYVFYFVDVNPATDNVKFGFQGNASGGSGFNEVITSSAFNALHNEADTTTALGYQAVDDQAQGTSYQNMSWEVGNGSDECCVGEFHLFSPSSTSKVKHFYSTMQMYNYHNFTRTGFVGGYINTTSAIDEISFKMTSGNFDGNIYLFGVS